MIGIMYFYYDDEFRMQSSGIMRLRKQIQDKRKQLCIKTTT